MKHKQQKRYLLGSKARISRAIGLSMKLHCKKLGFYRATVRGGMCDYYVAHHEREVPISKAFWMQLRAMGVLWLQEWEEVALKNWLERSLCRWSSPAWWLGCFGFLRGRIAKASALQQDAVNLEVAFITKMSEEGGRLSQLQGYQAHLQLKDNQEKCFDMLSTSLQLPPFKLCTVCDFGDRFSN